MVNDTVKIQISPQVILKPLVSFVESALSTHIEVRREFVLSQVRHVVSNGSHRDTEAERHLTLGHAPSSHIL
jgi:hypothetical protein